MNIEYRTILETAGYADWSNRGRIALEGPDSASFLQALVTNDLTPLTPRQGVYALYLTPQGRMIADLEIHDLGTSVLCEVAPGLASSLATRLDQLIFAENTRVTDVSAEHAEICILGGQAARRVEVLFGLSRESLEQLPELARIEIAGGFVTRSGESTLPSYRVFVPAAEGQAVIERLESLGTPLMSASLLQALRIANARAAWGSELGEQTIPLEAGLLERAISTSKVAARRIEEDFGATFSFDFEIGNGSGFERSGPQHVVARNAANEYPKDAEYARRVSPCSASGSAPCGTTRPSA